MKNLRLPHIIKILTALIVLVIGIHTPLPAEALFGEPKECLYLEQTIENLLVDYTFRNERVPGFDSPISLPYAGTVMLLNNAMQTHRVLDCDGKKLVDIFRKIPITRAMGEKLLFAEKYFSPSSKHYEYTAKGADAGSASGPSKTQVESGSIIKEQPKAKQVATGELKKPTQGKLSKFRKSEAPGKYESALETMAWRHSGDYLGYTVVPHPSGEFVVLVGCSLLKVLSSDGQNLKEIKIENCGNYGSAFSQDGKKFAYQNEGTFFVGTWIGLDLKDIAQCNGHTRNVLEIKFLHTDNSTLFTTSDDGTTRAWKISEGKCSETARHRIGGYSVALTTDGAAYFMDYEAETLKYINLQTGEKKKVGGKWDMPLNRILYHDQSKKLFGGGTVLHDRGDVLNVFEINTKTGKGIFFQRTGSALGSAFDKPHKIAISDNGRFVAYIRGYTGNQVYLIDTLLKKEVLQFEGISRDAKHLAFLPGATDFIIMNNDSLGEALYWQMKFQ